MNVRLLSIEIPPGVAVGASDMGAREIRVLLDVDGARTWYGIQARPQLLAGQRTTLLMADDALQDLFQTEQLALHRICKLVGDELRGRPVRVPQQVAA